jgi:N-acetylmuramoyl-L-alanine amidase
MPAVCVLALMLAAQLVPGTGAAVAAESTVARDARLVGNDLQRTRFIADLSKKVKFRFFSLADPYRVIVDLPDVKFQLPAGLGSKGRGLVAAYRYGLIAAGKARIVIDLKGPAMVDKAFVTEPNGNQPARLVIDLVRTDRKTFLAGVRPAAKPPARSAAKGPDISLRSSNKRKNGKPVVVIDPGHGGIDPGATSLSGLKEKDVVFAFSGALAERLRKTGRYKVHLTRTIDTYIALRERVALARKFEGDLFLSVHADSLPGRYSTRISGATVYTLSEEASDEEARQIANKENRSDIIAGVALPEKEDEVTGILIDLAMRETKNLSITFADLVLDNLNGHTPLMKKAHRFAGFRVLKAPDVPSVLIELGYMSNPADVENMTSEAWRKKVSKALVRSIDHYFAARSQGPRFRRPPRSSSAAR